MCYVHPIYPALCTHHYFVLLAICGPNASLLTCPSSSLIVTGPPGWNGQPRHIEDGLCPRCDLGNEGVDLSKVRFYKPEKMMDNKRRGAGWPTRGLGGSKGCFSWGVDTGNERKIFGKTNAYDTSKTATPSLESGSHAHQKEIYHSVHSHSVQSLPTPRTRDDLYNDNDDDGDLISLETCTSTDEKFPVNSHRTNRRHNRAQIRQTRQLRRWWHRHIPRLRRHDPLRTSPKASPLLTTSPVCTEDRGRCRDRIKTALKVIVGDVEHRLSRSRSRSCQPYGNSKHEEPPWEESASGKRPRKFRSGGKDGGEGSGEGSMVWSYGS